MKTKKACPPKPWCRRGSALLLTTILMFIILSMIVSLTYVTVMEQKMSQKTKSSVGAFYGAESGMEWALNKIATGTGTTISTKFGTQATNAATDGKMSCPFTGCEVYLLGADGKVIPKTKFSVADSADLVKAVRSVGAQGADTQRAIEAAVAGTDEKYDISCFAIDFSSVQTRQTCCRIDKQSGDTKCYSRSGPGVAWTNLFALPSAGSNGKYSLSCFHFDDSTTRQECCRIDAESGNTKCYWRESFDTSWYSAPTPDLPSS